MPSPERLAREKAIRDAQIAKIMESGPRDMWEYDLLERERRTLKYTKDMEQFGVILWEPRI